MKRHNRVRSRVGLAIAMAMYTLLFSCASLPQDEAYDEGYGDEYQEGDSGEEAPAVAILDFAVQSAASGYEALASDVPNALAEAFLRSGALLPIERSSLEKILAEQELSLSGAVDPGAAAQIGRLAGAQYVLLGSVTVIGDQVRLSGRLVDVESAEIHWAGSATGYTDEIFSVEEDLAFLAEEDLAE